MGDENRIADMYEENPAEVSRAEQLVLDAMRKVEDRDERHKKLERRNFHMMLAAAGMFLFLGSFFVFYAINSQKILANTIQEFTDAGHEFKYDDLGWAGQKELYRKHMMKLFVIYGHAYNKLDVRALSGTEKGQYINLCFDLAKDLGKPLSRWHGPIIAIQESDFNPKALGDFITIKDKDGKEVKVPTSYGMYQIKLGTAYHYKGYYDQLPDWFKNKYPIIVQCEEDLRNWRTSTILLYAGLWGYYEKEFMGEHQWVISAHHFGSTALSRHFNGGNGQLPSYFIYNGIKYPVDEYWTAFLGMKDAFEAGKLELGKPFAIRWKGVREQIRKEEVEFSKNLKIIKSLRAENNRMREELDQLKVDAKNHAEELDATYLKFKAAYGEIHAGKYKTVREVFHKARGIVKDWMLEYDKKMSKQNTLTWIFLILGLLALLTIQSFLVWQGAQKVLKWFKPFLFRLRKKFLTLSNSNDTIS